MHGFLTGIIRGFAVRKYHHNSIPEHSRSFIIFTFKDFPDLDSKSFQYIQGLSEPCIKLYDSDSKALYQHTYTDAPYLINHNDLTPIELQVLTFSKYLLPIALLI